MKINIWERGYVKLIKGGNSLKTTMEKIGLRKTIVKKQGHWNCWFGIIVSCGSACGWEVVLTRE